MIDIERPYPAKLDVEAHEGWVELQVQWEHEVQSYRWIDFEMHVWFWITWQIIKQRIKQFFK